MNTKLPIYELEVADMDSTGIFAVSFVAEPANESMFVALGKEFPVKMSLDKQKQIITGAVLIPEQLIYRDERMLGHECYVRFSADEIEKIARKMMREGLALKHTTHEHTQELEGNYLTELWLVADSQKDKSVALGLGEYPKGTLMASYKINDSKYWETEVMTGNVKGFSLEGYFNKSNINMKKTEQKENSFHKGRLAAFFSSVAAFLEGDSKSDAEALVEVAVKDEADSGEPFMIFVLADGTEVKVDADGFATRDGEQVPAGEHQLQDGTFIVIDGDGMLVVTEAEPQEAEEQTAPAELAKQRAQKFLEMRKQLDLKKESENEARLEKLEKTLDELLKQPSTDPLIPIQAKKNNERPKKRYELVSEFLREKNRIQGNE